LPFQFRYTFFRAEAFSVTISDVLTFFFGFSVTLVALLLTGFLKEILFFSYRPFVVFPGLPAALSFAFISSFREV